MKKSKVLLATTLLGVLAGVVGCGGNSSSSTNANSSTTSTVITSSSSSSSSTVISSSSEAAVPTEALTQEMFSGLQGGYESTFVRSTDYDGAGGSTYILEAKVNDKNYAFKRYSTTIDDNGNYQKKVFVEESHYQINPNEEEEWLYNAGLSIGNTVIYSPVMGRDKYSFQEIELTWEEGGYSNVFALLTIGDFTRVGDENKWALNVNDSALEAAGVYRMLASQFFGEEVEADIDHFYLLTNGDKITGFDLKWKTYLSYESYVTKFAFGTFEGFGADVTSFVTPLSDRTKDADFDNAIASLKNHNYKVNHAQYGYDFNANVMASRGHFEAECDGETLNYYYYTSAGKKYMNYAYYNYFMDGETYLQGATNIKGNYYPDVLYYGTLTDILPDFVVSSEMFIKSSASTDDVLVYDLDKSVRISLDCDNATYSAFDSDGYNDRTIYLTVTIDKVNGTVNFHNETSNSEDSGLIEDVTYSEIGSVTTLRTDANTKENADDLTWKDLFSNDEVAYDSLTSKFPESVLDNLPTFGGRYAYVSYDASGIIFVNTYEQAENTELLEGYGAKLEAAGYVKGSITSDGVTYPTYYTTFTSGKRTYGLTLTLFTYWNSIQEWGQFQVHISVGAAK